MLEIKTLAQKMDIGRYGKLGNGIPKFVIACGAAPKSGFHNTGDFCYTYWERHPTHMTIFASMYDVDTSYILLIPRCTDHVSLHTVHTPPTTSSTSLT